MRPSLRPRLSYANVVSTLALVLAMSGGALAASRYLINSTHQINPRVLRKLRGRTGPQGPAGIPGVSIQGPTGLRGARGEAGPPGPPSSAPTRLPSGQSESGVYALAAANAGAKETVETAVSFTLPLNVPIGAGNVVYASATATGTAHCAGPGHAERGFLCVYSDASSGVEAPAAIDTESAAQGAGTGSFGFALRWSTTAAGASDAGTYTVSAP